MNILAVETSSKAASCAFSRDGMIVAEFYTNAGLTHSQTIMPMVDNMLRCARASLAEVDVFAVSAGPGSFTGLRIGIAAVKGMAMAMEKPCAAVSTLHGLALNIRNFQGYIIPVLDARCSQVYTAQFAKDGPGIVRTCEDTAISVDGLKQRLPGDQFPKMLVGDGAKLCMEKLQTVKNLYIAPEHLLYQHASALCEAAAILAGEDKLISPDALTPAYLRLPQAERELTAKNNASTISGNHTGIYSK